MPCHAEADKHYSSLTRYSRDAARHARNTEKLALSQLLQSHFDEGEANLRRAQMERLAIFRAHYQGKHDHEYSDDTNCKGQVDYLARIQTNLALVGRRNHGPSAARQEQSIAAEIRALPNDSEGQDLVARYLHERLNSVQRLEIRKNSSTWSKQRNRCKCLLCPRK